MLDGVTLSILSPNSGLALQQPVCLLSHSEGHQNFRTPPSTAESIETPTGTTLALVSDTSDVESTYQGTSDA